MIAIKSPSVLLQPDIRQTSKKEDAKSNKHAPQRNNPTRTFIEGIHSCRTSILAFVRYLPKKGPVSRIVA